MQDGIEDIEWQAIRWVNNFDGGDVATSVVALAWMQDGVDDLEVNAIKELFFIDQDDSGVASSVVGLDWVRDRIEVLELEAIGWLNNYINPVVTSSVVDLAWVRDGIEEIEVKAIEELAYIDFYGAGEALRIVERICPSSKPLNPLTFRHWIPSRHWQGPDMTTSSASSPTRP